MNSHLLINCDICKGFFVGQNTDNPRGLGIHGFDRDERNFFYKPYPPHE